MGGGAVAAYGLKGSVPTVDSAVARSWRAVVMSVRISDTAQFSSGM